jgi:hypothetical protein
MTALHRSMCGQTLYAALVADLTTIFYATDLMDDPHDSTTITFSRSFPSPRLSFEALRAVPRSVSQLTPFSHALLASFSPRMGIDVSPRWVPDWVPESVPNTRPPTALAAFVTFHTKFRRGRDRHTILTSLTLSLTLPSSHRPTFCSRINVKRASSLPAPAER